MLASEFVPATQPESRRLMVVLHGLGDSSAGFGWLPGALRLPWLNYLLVNAPDAYYSGFSWYDFGGDPAPGVERSCRELLVLLEAQRAAGFPAEQATLFGFSQGCLMTVEVGFRAEHRFAGLVGVSGYVLSPPALLARLSPVAARQRMLFTHGTLDPLIPHAAVKEQVRALQTAGLNIQWREFVKPHTIDAAEELGVIRDFVAAGYAN